eukprot:TRINITY_DN33820_c0_g1_i1.p1 TRINITY_DN33820_c0_g1~~TRINITY_DN33820_c0_g1_i1.p1  ORF type:complete len:160 (+),score=47.48 TRINITY_DN33820_c0_g1_i1:58-537(+)
MPRPSPSASTDRGDDSGSTDLIKEATRLRMTEFAKSSAHEMCLATEEVEESLATHQTRFNRVQELGLRIREKKLAIDNDVKTLSRLGAELSELQSDIDRNVEDFAKMSREAGAKFEEEVRARCTNFNKLRKRDRDSVDSADSRHSRTRARLSIGSEHAI